MRLSESIKRNILDITSGSILNKFKLKSRSNVLFFEDILALYIKECEDSGHSKDMEDIAKKWMVYVMQEKTPELFKKTPILFMNSIMKSVWINLGLMDDIKVKKDRNTVTIETKNETPTRVIGNNRFIVGFYSGIISVIFELQTTCIYSKQSKKSCIYKFKLRKEQFTIQKSIKRVLKTKRLLEKNDTKNLKFALERGILKLKEDNRIYFRGKPIIFGEVTLSHIMGNSNIELDRIPAISNEYFKSLLKEDSSDEKKLLLLKNLLQIMGWGRYRILKNKNNLLFIIYNPPKGLQKEKNNWDFLIKTILGYIWLLDKKYKMKESHIKNNTLSVSFYKSS